MNLNPVDKKWIEVKISVSPEILEEISADFFALGCQGINEREEDFCIFFPAGNWDLNSKDKLLHLAARYKIPGNKIQFSDIEAENWNENWKENFTTFRLGKNIIITPDWENYVPKPLDVVLTITPKMAFGTGHHETTQLILEMMEDIVNPGMTVLDAGTGSAILAIYAAKKGASAVVAFDNDPEVMENAAENCELNSVHKNIQLQCAVLSEIKQQYFDLLLANINRNVLLEIAIDLRKYSKKGGLLVLSGLLETDKNDIINHYNNAGWNYKRGRQKGEWVALLLENSK